MRSLFSVATIFAVSTAAQSQLPKEIIGTWSGDPNCSRVAMKNVFGETTFEWHGDGTRFYLGEASYAIESGRLAVTLTRDIENNVKNQPGAPQAGDVLTYQRIGDGWRPYSMTRDGKVTPTPRDTPTFRRCP
jgi:hypothetical protein